MEISNAPANLFTNLPQDLSHEVAEKLASEGGIRIERIVSLGHSSPPGFWYDQEESEWVLLLQGAARLEFELDSDTLDMKPGDHILIPAHRRHRVAWTTPDMPTIWLAVYYAAIPARK